MAYQPRTPLLELEKASELAPERMEPRYSLIQAYPHVGREADAERQRAYLKTKATWANSLHWEREEGLYDLRGAK